MLGQVVGESNGFDLGIQAVISVCALLALAVPLWFSQRSIHRKQDQLYEHVNNVEDEERVDDSPRKHTLGSLTRETNTAVAAGFAHEQDVHEQIREEINALRDDLEAIRSEVRPNGNETRDS